MRGRAPAPGETSNHWFHHPLTFILVVCPWLFAGGQESPPGQAPHGGGGAVRPRLGPSSDQPGQDGLLDVKAVFGLVEDGLSIGLESLLVYLFAAISG